MKKIFFFLLFVMIIFSVFAFARPADKDISSLSISFIEQDTQLSKIDLIGKEQNKLLQNAFQRFNIAIHFFNKKEL